MLDQLCVTMKHQRRAVCCMQQYSNNTWVICCLQLLCATFVYSSGTVGVGISTCTHKPTTMCLRGSTHQGINIAGFKNVSQEIFSLVKQKFD